MVIHPNVSEHEWSDANASFRALADSAGKAKRVLRRKEIVPNVSEH